MNTDTISMIAAIVSALAGVAAVIIAIMIFRRQRNITLFEQRMGILKDYDHFLYDILTDWEWDGTYDPINRHPTYKLVSMFGPEFGAVHLEVLKTADYVEECNKRIQMIETDTEAVEDAQERMSNVSVEDLKVARAKRIEDTLRFYHEVVDRFYEDGFRI